MSIGEGRRIRDNPVITIHLCGLIGEEAVISLLKGL